MPAKAGENMVIDYRRQLNRVGDDLPDLFLNNEVIKRVEKTKSLGINIEESLKWKVQYRTVKNILKWGFPFGIKV